MDDHGHVHDADEHDRGRAAQRAKPVVVDVEITDDSNPDDVQCNLSSKEITIKGGDTLIFSNDHHPGFVITFQLTNTDRYKDYVFPNHVHDDRWHDAIWAKPIDDVHDSCPHLERWTGFWQLGVCKDNKTVTVSNPNPRKQLFKFALRFAKNANEAAVAMCDPIGDNQNGPTS
jgi:hypothetical protein